METAHSHTVSLDTGLNNIVNTDTTHFGPGPPSPTLVALEPSHLLSLHCEEYLEGSHVSSKKRIRFELGTLGRNICQKLLCGFFLKKGNNNAFLETSFYLNSFNGHYLNVESLKNPSGCWEADPNQLPQQL